MVDIIQKPSAVKLLICVSAHLHVDPSLGQQ